jgi:hypothetical protein
MVIQKNVFTCPVFVFLGLFDGMWLQFDSLYNFPLVNLTSIDTYSNVHNPSRGRFSGKFEESNNTI